MLLAAFTILLDLGLTTGYGYEQDDTLRELEWDQFVDTVKAFVERNGWSGVLSAVARAMRETIEEQG